MGSHGCAVPCLVCHDQEDRADNRAEIQRYGDELEGDELEGDKHEIGYGLASVEGGDAGNGETGDDETQKND